MKHFLPFLLAESLCAQNPLPLGEAVRRALRQNKTIAATGAEMCAASARIDEAHAGKLPKLNYSESFTGSGNPVFVFGSLLTQHQFGAENFNLGPLNRPNSLNNFQSLLTVDQALYDAGQTSDSLKCSKAVRGILRAVHDQRIAATMLELAAGQLAPDSEVLN